MLRARKTGPVEPDIVDPCAENRTQLLGRSGKACGNRRLQVSQTECRVGSPRFFQLMIGQASAEGWVEHAPSILNSAIALSTFMEPDSDPVALKGNGLQDPPERQVSLVHVSLSLSSLQLHN